MKKCGRSKKRKPPHRVFLKPRTKPKPSMEALVEITVSDSCNKNCSYCFEKHVDCHVDRFDEWKSLILNACEDIQANKLSDIDRL